MNSSDLHEYQEWSTEGLKGPIAHPAWRWYTLDFQTIKNY